MRTRFKILISLVILVIIAASLLSFWWAGQKQRMYEDSFQSSYSYSISIVTDRILNNATFYMPIPSMENTSSVGHDIVQQFIEDDSSWEYGLVETEHGPMLSMKKDIIIPVFYSGAVERKIPGSDPEQVEIIRTSSDEYSEKTPYPGTIDLSSMMTSSQSIDTMNPIGHEMVFMPKYDLLQNLTAYESRPWMAGQEHLKVYDYNSRIYAQYDTSSDANVSISVTLDTVNEWWIGGWRSNSYTDQMTIQLPGPQNNWVSPKGEIVTGIGIYMEG
jgi:hypothetical protein